MSQESRDICFQYILTVPWTFDDLVVESLPGKQLDDRLKFRWFQITRSSTQFLSTGCKQKILYNNLKKTYLYGNYQINGSCKYD